MPWYRLPDGRSAHLNVGRNKKGWPRNCQAPWDKDRTQWCSCMASKQCDWKMPGGKTCDKWLCDAHAFSVPGADDKDLCPEHKIAYDAWLARRGSPPPQ